VSAGVARGVTILSHGHTVSPQLPGHSGGPSLAWAPRMPSIQELLVQATQLGASDVHLSTGEPPAFRVHGDLERIEGAPLSAEQTMALIVTLMNAELRDHYDREHEADFACEVDGAGRFRVNAFIQNRGPAAVLRSIPTVVPTLDELGMPPILKQLCTRERGLILVTGPTGSGKSTTLAAMVNEVNLTWQGHILTVEDPIEFVHTPKQCIVNQREVGPHTNSFAAALKSALREDPDVILVGEMRDLETIALAVTAAETGHLVFGTLHTSSAAKTVDRLIDAFPAEQQGQIRTMLSESLEAVVAQKLLKKKGGGRVAALEVLVGVPAVRNLIREGKLHQIPSAMQTGQRVGMQTIDMAYTDLLKRGLVDRESLPVETGTPGLGGPGQPGAAATARPAAG
jgi:twitching motility protein PilT